MTWIVGTITKMWCEDPECEKEFSFQEYEQAGEACPHCGSEDLSWDSPDAVELPEDIELLEQIEI